MNPSERAELQAKWLSTPAIIHLRRAVNLFNTCEEGWVETFSRDSLLRLYDAYAVCGWDIPPDRWTDQQIQDALAGKPPCWDDDERPVYV